MKGVYINKKSNTYSRRVYIDCWDVEEIEDYFKKIKIPDMLKLNECATINNVANFIKSHLEFIKANNGNTFFTPYYDRLNELRN